MGFVNKLLNVFEAHFLFYKKEDVLGNGETEPTLSFLERVKLIEFLIIIIIIFEYH